MIIKKLDIISFGKFQNKTIEFNPQLNIISGSNESGKSTIAAFITSMLYGFGDNRGKSLSFREKYMPWSASFLEGSLTLISDDGKEITIYRKAGLQKKHDILKIFDSLTGAELDITPVSLTDTDFESFSKTLFITQGKSSFTGSTEEISARLSRLLSGGDEKYSITSALDILDEASREIRNLRGGGLLFETEKELEKIQAEEESFRQKKAEISDLKIQINALNTGILSLEKAQKELQEKLSECKYERLLGRIEEKESYLQAYAVSENNFFGNKSLRVISLSVFSLCLILCFFDFLFIIPSAFSLAFFIYCVFQTCKALPENKASENVELLKLREIYESEKKLFDSLSEKITAISKELSEKKTLLAKLTEKCKILEALPFSDRSDDFNKLRERKTELLKTLDAINLAKSALHTVNEESQSGFIPRLNSIASEYFSEITGGKYDLLRSDADFSLSVELLLPRQSAFFSGGTVDQMYLSLRLALADLLFDGKKTFMLIDQPFMQYDIFRKENAAKLLAKISKKRQILLFITNEDNISSLKSTEILT